MVVIDLSHKLANGMQIYPGDPHFSIVPWNIHEKDGCQVDKILMGSHSGTHIDAPWHIDTQGAKMDEIPVNRFIGNGVLVDVTGKGSGESIGIDDLTPVIDQIKPEDFLIFHTGWDRFFGQKAYLKHPYISPDLADKILHMEVSLVGIDTLSVDPTGTNIFATHEALMPSRILIVENLCNLQSVPQTRGIYSFLPLKLNGSDGSPVRAVFMDYS